MNAFLAILPQILVILLAGGLSGFITSRIFFADIKRILIDLEYRLDDIDGRVSREVKKRAEWMSKSSKEIDREVLAAASQGNSLGGVDLDKWRQQMFLRK